MSSQSSGSTIRLIVLFVLLGIVGFAFYNDTMNRKPEVEKFTGEFLELVNAEEGTLSPENLQSKINRKPDRTFKVGIYDVEEYKLRRTIPFLSFGSVYAIYENKELFKVAQGLEPTEESIGKPVGLESEQKPKVLDVAIGGMGLPTPNFEKKEGDKSEKSDKSEAKETPKEEAKEAPKEEGKEKPADDPSGGDKKEAEGEKKAGEEQPKEGDGG